MSVIHILYFFPLFLLFLRAQQHKNSVLALDWDENTNLEFKFSWKMMAYLMQHIIGNAFSDYRNNYFANFLARTKKK